MQPQQEKKGEKISNSAHRTQRSQTAFYVYFSPKQLPWWHSCNVDEQTLITFPDQKMERQREREQR